MIRTVFTVGCMVAALSFVSAQSQDLRNNFSPTTFIDTIPPAILADLKSRNEIFVNTIVTEDRSVLTSAKRLNDARFKGVIKLFNDDKMIVDGPIVQFLDSVLQVLLAANPIEGKKPFVYVYRDATANAFATPEGMLSCNLGLVSRLENSGEVAFVLAHELAHYLMQHSRSAVIELAKLDRDKDLKKQINQVNRSEYNQYTNMKQLADQFQLGINYHSRDHEFEADQYAVDMMARAGIEAGFAVRTLEILDSADQTKNPVILNLKNSFDFPGHPFKDGWTKYAKAGRWHLPADGDTDTTKTHPDCNRRIKAIQDQQNQPKLRGADYAKREISVQYLSDLADYEIIESEFHQNRYGKSMFHALLLQLTFPQNIYLRSRVARNLLLLYVAQRDHVFGKYVTLPDDRFPENYDRFLTFLHQLRLTELAMLAEQYTISSKEVYFDDDDFLYTFWLVSQLPGTTMDPQLVAEDYLSKFPSGKYAKSIKSKNK